MAKKKKPAARPAPKHRSPTEAVALSRLIESPASAFARAQTTARTLPGAGPRSMWEARQQHALMRHARALEEYTRALETARPPELAASAKAPDPARGKLSEPALDEHVRRHEIGKRKADGSWFSVSDRVQTLWTEQGIRIHRTTLQKRLKLFIERRRAHLNP
jgi:hypothetical protein